MNNYVLPVSSLPKYLLDRPQQSSIQQILRLGYLQESNRTQLSGTILSRNIGGVSCWTAGGWTYPSKTGRRQHRPGGYVAFYDLALLGRAILVKETIGD